MFRRRPAYFDSNSQCNTLNDSMCRFPALAPWLALSGSKTPPALFSPMCTRLVRGANSCGTEASLRHGSVTLHYGATVISCDDSLQLSIFILFRIHSATKRASADWMLGAATNRNAKSPRWGVSNKELKNRDESMQARSVRIEKTAFTP